MYNERWLGFGVGPCSSRRFGTTGKLRVWLKVTTTGGGAITGLGHTGDVKSRSSKTIAVVFNGGGSLLPCLLSPNRFSSPLSLVLLLGLEHCDCNLESSVFPATGLVTVPRSPF
ncbi:unnamed protein product [Brassica rapa]|uniref:Uncharacterized protein n=2 Tax=Brassica TaxID=3705 RepID=A0A8D9HEV4_BRACM|nr:unnamed protein product [Brassica napus]CAG7897129.1 unnamed protein product [Brassica rapa]